MRERVVKCVSFVFAPVDDFPAVTVDSANGEFFIFIFLLCVVVFAVCCQVQLNIAAEFFLIS